MIHSVHNFFLLFFNLVKKCFSIYEGTLNLNVSRNTFFSRNLQNQERITNQVADYLQDNLRAKGVAVVLKARHLCMEMRGVKKSDTHTVTSKLLGYFRTDERTRAEFLNLIGNHRN